MNDTLNFELKKNGEIAIFKLNEPRLDANIAGLLKGEFTIILHAEEVNKLILDLSQIEYCDSSGLSAILLAFRVIKTNEGHIRIASPSKNVRSLIEISQLDRVLPIAETVEDAQKELEQI